MKDRQVESYHRKHFSFIAFAFCLLAVIGAIVLPIYRSSAQQVGIVFPAGKLAAQVVSRNTALSTTNLIAGTGTQVLQPGSYLIQLYAYDSVAGVACTANTTVTWTFTYTDQTGTSQTSTATETITTNGGATGGDALKTTLPIDVSGAAAISVATTYTIGTGCTTGPSYAADIKIFL